MFLILEFSHSVALSPPLQDTVTDSGGKIRLLGKAKPIAVGSRRGLLGIGSPVESMAAITRSHPGV